MLTHNILIIFFILCCFAFLLPVVAYKRGNVIYLVCVLFSALQLVVYHQGFRWDVVGVIWRDILFLSLLVSVYFAMRLRKKRGKSTRFLAPTSYLIVVICFIVSKWALPYIITNSYPDQLILNVSSPLKQGKFFVAQGGPNSFYNFNHQLVPAQKYAYDITMVKQIIGIRGPRLLDLKPGDFYAMHEPVFSPCNGTVTFISEPGENKTKEENEILKIAGNSVVVECDDNVIVLAHLNDIYVEIGEAVFKEIQIGTIGSTGRSSDPHLHIHAVRGKYESIDCSYFSCEGLPLQFQNELLLKNDVF